jgi:chorismate mutase
MIQEVSQQALDLNYDGLIIETHIDPDNAWSDAAQQITPSTLKQLFIDLKMRKPTDENAEWNIALAMQRAYIDELDTKLIDFLGKRMVVAEKIGQLKKEKNVAILQNKRWNAILDKMILDGSEKGLSEEFILKIFKAIHQESIAHQEKVFKK